MKIKRVFLTVLDSFGIGYLPDADAYGDVGSNTLGAVATSDKFHTPNMARLGLFNIDGVNCATPYENPEGAFARLTEQSKGKDTTIGHWEISGIVSKEPLPTYPNGFPDEIIHEFSKLTGRKVICNKPYSGTKVIDDYGKEHVETGALIVYTSADSVFQIAAHEDVVPLEELYEYCHIARELLIGEHGVGRVIARPFNGSYPEFKRTAGRHDYSITPPRSTMLDYLKKSGLDVIAIGKISDIFSGSGVTESYTTKNNQDGMNRTMEMLHKDFEGLCFTNLVDFDMVYGHRNDVEGYANALTEYDIRLGEFLKEMREDDVLIITADHGCDPSTESTDHSREYVPVMIYGKSIQPSTNLGTRACFGDIAATILELFKVDGEVNGTSMVPFIMKTGEEQADVATHKTLSEEQPGAATYETLSEEQSGIATYNALSEEKIQRLVREAIEARERSYSPYSNFAVGASLLTKEGKSYQGCNIENAAFGPTNCAERTAIFKAVYEGERDFEAIAIVAGPTDGRPYDNYCAPCGICLQVMMEFCNPDTFQLILIKNAQDYKVCTLKELLPMGFGAADLGK